MQEQIDQFLHHLKHEKGYSDNTIAAYRNDLHQFMAFLNQTAMGGANSWGEVDHQLILSYGAHLDERDYTVSTIARKVASVKSFFSFLLTAGLVTNNPTSVLGVPKVEKRMPRILSTEEIEGLLTEPVKITTPKASRDRALLHLLYATGMRVSEAITLQVDDLDMEEARVTCRGRDGKERGLPLDQRTVESLAIYLEKGRKVLLEGQEERTLFVNQRGRPLTRQGLWLIIKSYVEAAGLGSGVTPHTLRHSFAVRRLVEGGDLHQVQKLLGHVNISATQIYMDVVNSIAEESDLNLT